MQYGTSYVASGKVVLWSSNTSNQTGNTAILNSSGSLSVQNSNGTSVFSTDNSKATPGNYLGCYGDSSNRAMPLYNGGSQEYNLEQCQQIAQQNGSTYFGLQNSTNGITAQCGLSNNITQTREYGKAGNCTQLSDGTYSGGSWSNAVYNNAEPSSFYFLILQDDGNLCIYRGSGPNDNQGAIWCSMTNGQQQKPNSNYKASAGKYGQPWISSGDTLAAGDFVGSNDGSIYLIMQTDGNLVLYTSQNIENCSKMTDGHIGGGEYANALYNIGKQAIPGNLGQLAYIDPNAKLHLYDSSNTTYINEYTPFTGDSGGSDIPGGYGNATVEQCKNTCNELSEQCAGFTFDNQNKVCYPKNSGMYPNSQLTPNIGSNRNLTTYIKKKIPKNTPTGISKTTNNTDTITYQNYINGGSFEDKYGLSKITSVQQQQLEQLESTLNVLSNKIAELNNNYANSNELANHQSTKNVFGLKDYLKEYGTTNAKINDFPRNSVVDPILQDSDIVVLQKNYSYLFWSTLAIGSVLVTMSVVKK